MSKSVVYFDNITEKRIGKQKIDNTRLRDIMILLEDAQNRIIEKRKKLSKQDKQLDGVISKAWSDIDAVWDNLNKGLVLDQ